jgi:hypothetical protein
METAAIMSGAGALLAGVLKYSIDWYRAKHRQPSVSISIGNATIEVPVSYTEDQVAALVSVLKARISTSPATK